MKVTDQIIDYVVKLSYQDFSNELIEVTKYRILDTLGTMVAGSSTPGCEKLVKILQSWGGRNESTIAVYGDKVPTPLAALANCTMARAREMDDVHEKAGTHASAQIVPSALCIAEYAKSRHNRPIDGKNFIQSVILGTDLVIRLRKAGREDGPEMGWVGETFTPLAVSLMGAKMLNLSKEKTLNAMGIGYAQCAGNAQANVDGAFTVTLQQGLGAQGGALALILAEEGLTGASEPLEGKYGFYELYLRGNFSPEVLLGGLGENFEGMNISTKFFPCCQGNHAAIEGATQLVGRHHLNTDDIEHIVIRTNSFFTSILATPEKIHPKSSYDAQFSLYYTVARALVSKELKIDDFSERRINEEAVLKCSNKIRVEADTSKDTLKDLVPPVDVEILMKNKQRYMTTVEHVKGHPKNPGMASDYEKKFDECVDFSAKPLRKEATEKVKEMVENLQDLEDVSLIMKELSH